MSESKMRTEFELWVISNWPNQSLGRFNPLHGVTEGEYTGFTVQHCWEAWQASREADARSTASPEVQAMLKQFEIDEAAEIQRAETFVRATGRASISAIQRNFKLGYGSACRLMDKLVARGVVSPIDSEGRRTVLPVKVSQ